MIRVHVFCEGQTEEMFVKELLYDYFSEMNIFLNPFLISTSSHTKGGVLRYVAIKPQLHRKCTEDRSAYVTTMFDLYRLPSDFPGKSTITAIDPYDKVEFLEGKLQEDIGHRNFIANLLLHEFEGLLFSSPDAFASWFGDEPAEQLNRERRSFETPEHINEEPDTAPSKRILKHCNGYSKPLHGALIALDIGLDAIRRECRHFDGWIERLLSLAEEDRRSHDSVDKALKFDDPSPEKGKNE